MDTSTKVLIASGGTGGHLYPGLALARELKQRDIEPLFVVRNNDAGREILSREGFSFFEIPICGMPRSLSLKLFSFTFLFTRSLFAARRVIKETAPAVIVGMGGYISFPVALIGRLRRIPVMIHEQNYIPGLSNRLLLPLVNRVAVSFEDSLKYFPAEKTVCTGNPVRRELFEVDPSTAYKNLGLSPDKYTILVFGGSQGAAKINRTVVEAAVRLEAIADRIQFLHLSGPRDFPLMDREYVDRKLPGRVLPYLHAIGEAYRVADLIICRSGATTVAELKILNKPAVLIPLLHATENHQEFNASVLVRSGSATLVREQELIPEKLADIISERFRNHRRGTTAAKIPEILPQKALADIVLQLMR